MDLWYGTPSEEIVFSIRLLPRFEVELEITSCIRELIGFSWMGPTIAVLEVSQTHTAASTHTLPSSISSQCCSSKPLLVYGSG